MIWLFIGVAVATGLCGYIVRQMRLRGLDRWVVPYLLQSFKRRPPRDGDEIHVLLCLADHFEPKGGKASPEVAWRRVQHWVREYPRQLAGFRDSDGRPPRHTFFYPIEEYEPAYLDALAELCHAGLAEVEIHLHHDNDTAENLRRRLVEFKELFAQRHGLLARNRQTGELAYGFIHGNWSLCNARADGRWCGVNEELDILRETGCYADFTMPSAPHVTQIGKINSLYYATNRPGRPRSHDRGTDVGAAPRPPNSLLLVQGPLVYAWGKGRWGLAPALENGCIQGSQLLRLERLPAWLRASVQVPSRPDWFFVKLHAHGAEEASHDALLGEPMVRFHRELAEHAQRNPRFHYHYVTAREMYNLVKAAEAGWRGGVAEALDFELLPNCCGASAAASDTTPGFSSSLRGTAPPARSPGPAAPG